MLARGFPNRRDNNKTTEKSFQCVQGQTVTLMILNFVFATINELIMGTLMRAISEYLQRGLALFWLRISFEPYFPPVSCSFYETKFENIPDLTSQKLLITCMTIFDKGIQRDNFSLFNTFLSQQAKYLVYKRWHKAEIHRNQLYVTYHELQGRTTIKQ